ncbi:hypothetical protein GFO_3133 [Christiangramia forsetii KT0803]|uniref:Uncharacterized protein n=3 Tax=Christiangramia forsetii TaxID=411153 RepID=A0M632_CHRFK|nr:hypothetical protein GCM10011532_13770 [Christiangramia forsetii]CAL68077.1 hypothetical protein GFO_3133 [Christiangramia forsetii KT0803]
MDKTNAIIAMKKLFGLLILSLTLLSCQDEDRKELMDKPQTEKVPDSIQVLEGEFVYSAEAAVMRGENFVYGVTLDSMSKVLSKKIAPLKSDDFEMIPVTIKAQIKPNIAQEGWEEMIEIIEIIEVPEGAKVLDTIKD